MAVQKLKVGIAGLGRMGKRHAVNYLHRTPGAEVVAAFTPDPTEQVWAKENLEPYGVTIYSDYDKMLTHSGLQAVIIATATKVHAEESLSALAKDLHVLCEKPISLDVATCENVIKAAEAKPHLKFLCGFSRRFDASYRDAYEKAKAGTIGEPVFVRSQTCDKHTPGDFFVKYAEHSGGCFADMSVHDIDLTLWFFGEHTPVKSISASGIRAVHPDLAQFNDYDNAVGIVEFWGGKVAYYFCSRMMAHGQEDTTEIIGTGGKLVVNGNPQANLLNTYTNNGIIRETPPDYWGRFEYAFVTESKEFTDAILNNTPLPFGLNGALRAVQIGGALQEALVSGKKLFFDESGKRIP